MMKLARTIKFLTLLIFITNSYSEENQQVIPGGVVPAAMESSDAGESSYFLNENTKPMDEVKDGESSYFLNENSKPMEKVKASSTSPAMIPDGDNYEKSVSGKGSATQFGSGVPFSGAASDSYISYTNEEILSSIRKKSKSSFSFEFIQNNFDYDDDSGVYAKTFESDSGSRGGALHISNDNFLYKGFMNFGYGGGIGLGYSTGKGIFTGDNSVSETNFNLYSLPIDLRLLVELPLGNYMKLSLAGGPGVMALIQNRSDRDHSDSDKERRQIGYGYFGEGKLKFNLSYIFTDTGFDYYKFYEISFMSLDLITRIQSYTGFKDNVDISGMAYGLGFTFEFL